jgi:hypothetical protein
MFVSIRLNIIFSELFRSRNRFNFGYKPKEFCSSGLFFSFLEYDDNFFISACLYGILI